MTLPAGTTSTAEIAATTVASTATHPARSLCLRARFGDLDVAPIQLFFIELGDGRGGLRIIGHLDKGKALRAAGSGLSDERYRCDCPDSSEELGQLGIGSLIAEVSYVDSLSHCLILLWQLHRPHVCGLQALWALFNFEFNLLALGQGVEALALDRGVMNENVLLTFTRDKAIPLAIVEPLDGSCNPFGHVKHSFILVLLEGEAV
jgi:hypothetical protein